MYRGGTVPNSNAIAPVKSLLFFHETAQIIPQFAGYILLNTWNGEKRVRKYSVEVVAVGCVRRGKKRGRPRHCDQKRGRPQHCGSELAPRNGIVYTRTELGGWMRQFPSVAGKTGNS